MCGRGEDLVKFRRHDLGVFDRHTSRCVRKWDVPKKKARIKPCTLYESSIAGVADAGRTRLLIASARET